MAAWTGEISSVLGFSSSALCTRKLAPELFFPRLFWQLHPGRLTVGGVTRSQLYTATGKMCVQRCLVRAPLVSRGFGCHASKPKVQLCFLTYCCPWPDLLLFGGDGESTSPRSDQPLSGGKNQSSPKRQTFRPVPQCLWYNSELSSAPAWAGGSKAAELEFFISLETKLVGFY